MSSTATYFRTSVFPVSVSTSTTQMCAPNGNTRFSGSKNAEPSSPGSTPWGRLCARHAENAVLHRLARRAPLADGTPVLPPRAHPGDLEPVRGDLVGLLADTGGGPRDRGRPTHTAAPVGSQPLGRTPASPKMTPTPSPRSELVGGDLGVRPRCSCPCGASASPVITTTFRWGGNPSWPPPTLRPRTERRRRPALDGPQPQSRGRWRTRSELLPRPRPPEPAAPCGTARSRHLPPRRRAWRVVAAAEPIPSARRRLRGR